MINRPEIHNIDDVAKYIIALEERIEVLEKYNSTMPSTPISLKEKVQAMNQDQSEV